MTDMKPKNYSSVLDALKGKIRQGRIRAALSVNSQLLTTYWEIGITIIKQQKVGRFAQVFSSRQFFLNSK